MNIKSDIYVTGLPLGKVEHATVTKRSGL